jgi:hypothetical protein
MNLRTTLVAVAGIAALAVVMVVAGCGGGGTPAVTTGVTGIVQDADSGQGIGNMTVMVGTASGISTTPEGAFTVQAKPGLKQVVSVVPTALFVQVPGPTLYADVVQGQLTSTFYTMSGGIKTEVAGPILVIDPHSLPPSG